MRCTLWTPWLWLPLLGCGPNPEPFRPAQWNSLELDQAARASAVQRHAGKSGWEGFPVFVWRQTHAGQPLPPQLSAAFRGTNAKREELLDWADGLDFYVDFAAGRRLLHLDGDSPQWIAQVEHFKTSRDARWLVREPCLLEASGQRDGELQLARTFASLGERAPLFAALGDEISLTPNGQPFELCQCALCNAAFAREAALLFPPGWAGALHEPSTDALLALLADDWDSPAASAGLALWLARRDFQQRQLQSVLAHLAGVSTRIAPGTPLAAMGLSGETVFGGLAPTPLQRWCTVFEPYAVGDAREQCATLRALELAPQARLCVTLFVDPQAPATAARALEEHLLRGFDGAVVWSDTELEASPAARAALEQAVAGARGFPADFAPRPAGVAWVHSMPSQRLCWLREAQNDEGSWTERLSSYQEQHGGYERRRWAWLRAAEAAGFLPGALDVQLVGPATLRQFEALVLDGLEALGADELAGLEAYAAAGGKLCVRGALGLRDNLGQRRASSALEQLQLRCPQALVVLPASAERELQQLCDGPQDFDRARQALHLQAFVREQLSPRGAPFDLEGARLRVLAAAPGGAQWWAATFDERPRTLQHAPDFEVQQVLLEDGLGLWLARARTAAMASGR